jgi:hypothetical protein
MMELEGNARLVSQFTSKVRNLSRVAELADAFIDMAASGAWREYTFATGHFRWRASEFDYFLIANGVRRDDAARVLAYNKRAKELLPLMDEGVDKRKRRPFEQAAKEYQSADSLNTDLVATAADLGWINGNRFSDVKSTAKGAQIPVKSPIPKFTRNNVGSKLNRWKVDWSDDRPAAQAIVDKLLADPDLAHEVYKRLDADNSRRKYEKKRRSVA